VTHITLTLKNGRITNKKAEYIKVKNTTQKNRLVEAMVQYFNKNPYFERIIAEAAVPFTHKDELTFLMCDAFLEEGTGDISIINNGGVRLDSIAAGTITMGEVLSMDPFNNLAVKMYLTGEEILKLLTTYSRGSLYHLPRVGGIICEVTVDKDDQYKDRLKRVKLMTLDGQEFDLEKTYKVITNSYLASLCKPFLNKDYESLHIHTADMLINYLKKQKTISPTKIERLKIKEE
jgi:5'-nucleotidase/2',3'-cyclic-nucleotide 2'-phosphodiesterase/3'-nucleotidase/5'-nucleotidase